MHVSSFMLKNALLNADESTNENFLKEFKTVLKTIIKDNKLSIKVSKIDETLDNKALYQFAINFKSKSLNSSYFILLQALRIASLLHDVGHLPFSHQVEYSLKKVFQDVSKKQTPSQKEKDFLKTYSNTTSNNEKVLHEAIGEKLIDLLFQEELNKTISEQKDYLKLIQILCKYILEEKLYKGFDFSVIHSIVSGTIDSDRLDYINRDMVASGYISAANDNLRVTKHTVLVKDQEKYLISFYDMGLLDIEHILEMRFNLYKKVIFNFGIAKTDTLLENVVEYLAKKYFKSGIIEEKNSPDSISMLWDFISEKKGNKKLDIVSMLDENWLILLFKKEYFRIKNKKNKSNANIKYLKSFEEVLFGKRFFKCPWKNLNEFHKALNFSSIESYKFRESFGFLTKTKYEKLQSELENFINKHEKLNDNIFFIYQIVSFPLGINKEFKLYDGENLIQIDEISTVRKRLKKSMLNTVPFYIYSNKKELNDEIKKELKDIIFRVF